MQCKLYFVECSLQDHINLENNIKELAALPNQKYLKELLKRQEQKKTCCRIATNALFFKSWWHLQTNAKVSIKTEHDKSRLNGNMAHYYTLSDSFAKHSKCHTYILWRRKWEITENTQILSVFMIPTKS